MQIIIAQILVLMTQCGQNLQMSCDLFEYFFTYEQRVFLARFGIWAHEPFTKWASVLAFILATILWVTNEEELGASIVINANRSLAPLDKDLSYSVNFDADVIISFKRYVTSVQRRHLYTLWARMIKGNKYFVWAKIYQDPIYLLIIGWATQHWESKN